MWGKGTPYRTLLRAAAGVRCYLGASILLWHARRGPNPRRDRYRPWRHGSGTRRSYARPCRLCEGCASRQPSAAAFHSRPGRVWARAPHGFSLVWGCCACCLVGSVSSAIRCHRAASLSHEVLSASSLDLFACKRHSSAFRR